MAKYVTLASDKKKVTALLLCIFTGIFGGHYFYVRRYGRALLYLFTLGLFMFGPIFDFFTILLGKFRDSDGLPVRR